MRPAKLRYDNLAISLHWLLALLLVAAFAVGMYMSDLPFSIRRVKLVNWHKWAGMTILALTLLRLLWRLGHAPPPDAAGPAWQQRASHLTHGALYLLCLGVPLDVRFDGKHPGDAQQGLVGQGARLLVLLHVAAALKHHFVDGDGLLSRMRPGLR